MSNIGSVTEAAGVLFGIQEKLREASVEAQSVIAFLERMGTETAGLGLEQFASRVEGVKSETEEWITELDGLSEAGLDALQVGVQGLSNRG